MYTDIIKKKINWIVNVENQFIKYVIIGNYAICEIPQNIQIYNKDKTYLYTGNIEWLKLEDFNTYTIDYKNKIYNVWFCKIVSFEYILKNTELRKIISKENIENIKTCKLNIKKCNIINARCDKSMVKLDEFHRDFMTKHIFKNKQIIAIKSVAGSGKTTTLLNLANIHNKKKILYLAFNKSLIDEIKIKISKENIKNLYPITFDALMRNTYLKFNDEPNIIDLKPMNLGDVIEWFNKKPYRLKNSYISKFNKFCNQIKYNSIEKFCEYELKKYDNLLVKLWEKVNRNEFQTFDSIRKIVQINHLCNKYIDNTYDLIFIDEAQDFDKLMLEILLEDTNIPKLFVGDTLQAIYEWRGCINAFNNLPKKTIFIEFYSTFRIGNPACNLIREKFNNCWMISKSNNKTILDYDKIPKNKYTYLFRTWRNLLLTAQKTTNIWIYNYDKQKNVIEKLHNKLQNYKLTKGEEFTFEDDLPAFLLKMSKEELEILLNDIENNLTNKYDSMCHMYTIHSYKGLETDIIKIYNDIDIEKESNLYYVALTRGKQNIILDTTDKNINSYIKKETINTCKNTTDIITLDLFKSGMNIEKISDTRKLTIGTIYTHLTKHITDPYVTWDKFMLEETYNKIINSIENLGVESIVNIKNDIPEDISYNDIKLVIQLHNLSNSIYNNLSNSIHNNKDNNIDNNINYNIDTECNHNIIIKSVKKTGGLMEGKIIVKISGPKVTNKSKIKTLYSSTIDESLILISKYLKINLELLTLKKV